MIIDHSRTVVKSSNFEDTQFEHRLAIPIPSWFYSFPQGK